MYSLAHQSGPDSHKASVLLQCSTACAHLHTTHNTCSLHNAGLNRFPFNNFTRCLTPFSRCFSSFPHGTCSLSVSCRYLALDEVYHPLWAAFPNNSTLWECLVCPLYIAQTGFSPSVMVHSRTLVQCSMCDNTSLDYNSGLSARFQIWALPTSLAVTTGILVSFFSSAYWYA